MTRGEHYMERKQQLEKILEKLPDKDLVNQIVEEVIFLEKQIEYLKTLPFIKVHPDNPEIQKETPAAKQYHHMMQAYQNNIKLLISYIRKTDISEDTEDAFMQFVKKWGSND